MEEARGYVLIEASHREILHDCKKFAEAHAAGSPHSPWGDGLRHETNRIAFAIERDLGRCRWFGRKVQFGADRLWP